MMGGTATPFFVFDYLGGGVAMAGIFAGCQSMAYALTCILATGYVARAKHTLAWVSLGLLMLIGLYATLPLFRTPWLCVLLTTIALGGQALVWPALHAWVGGEPDAKKRARNMSTFNISWSSGVALTPLLAGPMYDHDYRLPFLGMGILGVLTLCIIRTMPREDQHFAAASEESLNIRASEQRQAEVYLLAGWCANMMANCLVGATRSAFPKRIDNLIAEGQLRVFFEAIPSAAINADPATRYSILAFGLAACTALAFYLMGRSEAWRYRLQILLWVQVAAAAACTVLGQTKSLTVMMFCFMLIGFNYGYSFFSSVYYSLASLQHKHRNATANEAAVGVGVLIGSFAFGFIGDAWGVRVPFLLTPILMAAALALQLYLVHASRRRAAAASETPPVLPPMRPDAL
ncbi:MAG: MFS transporter [Candidatus Hydrogenedentes bacterium]|nr:MFS transporter [Candidatus Hydrogenedentota bacterium]